MKALLILLALCETAVAEDYDVDSVEWRAADATVVVRGYIASVAMRVENMGYGTAPLSWYDVTIKVTESLEGGSKETVRLGIRGDARVPTWLANKTDMLWFLIDGKSEELFDKGYARYPYAPRRADSTAEPFVELGVTPVYTTALGVLVKTADVLAATRAAVRAGGTSLHKFPVPARSAIAKAMPSRNNWLRVPVNRALEELAIRWIESSDPDTRQAGLHALVHFESAANHARLRKLLADPYFVIDNATQPPSKRYLVRELVRDVFAHWKALH